MRVGAEAVEAAVEAEGVLRRWRWWWERVEVGGGVAVCINY